MTTTQFPTYNVRADMDWIFQATKMDTAVDVRYGANFDDKTNRFYLAHKANFVGSKHIFKMDHQGKILAKPLV